MDYTRSTNYSLHAQGSTGYSDYRRNFAEGMNVPLVSTADPMKANTGNAALYEEEPGCCSKCCKWGMCGLTIALVICILVAGVMYKDCDHLPGFGVKDGCKHPHPAHHGGGSASDGEGGFFDEDYASDGGDGGAGWVGPQPGGGWAGIFR